MKFQLWAAVSVFALAAAVPASAQGRGDRGNANTRTEKPHVVTSDSVERLNPISPLIARRRDIGIPDSLLGKLGAILSRLDATNARALRQIDSLAAAGAAGGGAGRGESSGEQRAPSTVSLDVLIGEISKNNDTAAQDALNLMPTSVQGRALKVINDQRDKLQHLLRDAGFDQR